MSQQTSDAGRPQTPLWRQVAEFLPDVGRLLWALARDPRVPWHAKALAAGAVAYAISPIDVIPDFVPVVGAADDVYLVVLATRHLFASAGYDVVHELWGGTEDAFALLLMVAGIET